MRSTASARFAIVTNTQPCCGLSSGINNVPAIPLHPGPGKIAIVSTLSKIAILVLYVERPRTDCLAETDSRRTRSQLDNLPPSRRTSIAPKPSDGSKPSHTRTTAMTGVMPMSTTSMEGTMDR